MNEAQTGTGNLRERNVRTVGEFFARLEAMDVEGFVGLWAEDGVQEMPFAPEGFPKRLEGKAAIRRQYGGLPDAYWSMAFPEPRIHPMLDPNLVVAEYGGRISLKSGGTYDNRYVGVFRFAEDGRISHFTEYFDPIVLSRSFGGEALGQTFSLPEDVSGEE